VNSPDINLASDFFLGGFLKGFYKLFGLFTFGHELLFGGQDFIL